MTTLSIGDFCVAVKSPASQSPAFRLPNVIAIQKGDSYRKVFLSLYSISDQCSTFQLNAAEVSQATGLSRKTVYEVIAFLKRVHLLRPITLKTGRGQHSTYQLNWRKPSQNHQFKKQTKQPSTIAYTIEQEKCHPLKKYEVKDIHPSGDGAIAQIITPQNPILWKRCMKSFRGLLEQSTLSKSQQRLCIGVLGRHLKGKSREYGLRVFEKMQDTVIYYGTIPGEVKSDLPSRSFTKEWRPNGGVSRSSSNRSGLPSWRAGRIVFIGRLAHATNPTFSSNSP